MNTLVCTVARDGREVLTLNAQDNTLEGLMFMAWAAVAGATRNGKTIQHEDKLAVYTNVNRLLGQALVAGELDHSSLAVLSNYAQYIAQSGNPFLHLLDALAEACVALTYALDRREQAHIDLDLAFVMWRQGFLCR